MTVAELIQELREFPPDLTVMADDHEDGRYEIKGSGLSDYYGTLPRHVVVLG